MSNRSVESAKIVRVGEDEEEELRDLVAVEEPLAIRLEYGLEGQRQQRDLSVTMRTPGHDFELAQGFLFTEGIIRSARDIQSIRYCQRAKDASDAENIVRVNLSPDLPFDWKKLQRNFYTNSSCGVCGKTSIESIQTLCSPVISDSFSVSSEVIHQAPRALRKAQLIFEHTGGLHAAGLFSQNGELLLWREDIGRHNALDKLMGAALSQFQLPLSQYFILLSGRISFELVQKALMAGVPLLAAVGAPSSLAVQLAQQYGMSLLGFVRNQRFNIYSAPQHVVIPQPSL